MNDDVKMKQSGLGLISGLAILLGILGFIPGITHNYQLFWLAQVSPWFNTIYIVAGLVGFAVMSAGEHSSQTYLRFLTVVFALWAVIGLFTGDNQVLGFIDNNYWSVLLNAIMAVFAGSLGWASYEAAVPTRQQSVAFGEFKRDEDER